MLGKELPTFGNRSLKEEEDACPLTIFRGVLPEIGHHFATENATKVPKEDQERAIRGKVAVKGIGLQVDAVD